MDKTIQQLVDLSGKVAIVTGGGMGIGQGIARRLHEAGASVIIADMNEAASQAEAVLLNDKRANSALAVKTDVSRTDDVTTMVEATVARFGRIDILVNNAGIFPFRDFFEVDEALFRKVIDVNVQGVYFCSQAVAKQMVAGGQSGKIINITSIDALHPTMKGLAHYDASKHAVWGLTKSLALELGPNITVNAIAPGAIATPGAGAVDGKANPAAEAMVAAFPLGCIGQPDDIGTVALFLASDMARYITGEQIVVDGGALLT